MSVSLGKNGLIFFTERGDLWATACLVLALAGYEARPAATAAQVRLKPDTTEDRQVRVKPGTTAPAPPARRTLPARNRRAIAELKRDIDAMLAAPALERGFWGVVVKSLKSGDTLYSLNARKLMMPASTMKIVTLAATAERLGWDYTYETQWLGAGAIHDGVLDGDLIVVGSGDPSIMDDAAVFDDWAVRLKSAGVESIRGRIIGDDNAFDDDGLGFGWSWDDLPDDYAAGVSAVQFNENAARIAIAPASAVGDAAAITVTPDGTGLSVVNLVVTVAAGSQSSVSVRRLPGSARLEVRGSIPRKAADMVRTIAVDNPTIFFVNAVRAALVTRGIDVQGPAVDIDEIGDAPARTDAVLLLSHRSPPLSTLAQRLMKVSQNLYAETMLKTIGAAAGTPTAAFGRSTAQTVFEGWGIGADSLIQRDGSGLSRYDYVTADALVGILTHVHRDARLRGPFAASLPIAGRDGTLANRMKETAAEDNARAKTGSMANVRALSGYVTAADGEPLVFSIMANNFDAPGATITQTIDAIVVRLATFKR
jgi:D-alanyl-D-alanine carboxypeptidase/D-alanyl-D-alanine-endopeptidase (penicillin-binding protein 4)